jgi:tRNA A-37 threonylcarbamoyl transferase component Bud32
MYWLQAGAAALLRMPVLKPPAVSRYSAGLRAEARRLRRLRAKGWQVPEVVDISDRWLALADNGKSLAPTLMQLPPVQRPALLREALAYLQSLHAQGSWHGAAQVRNFTQREKGFGLIDFEDDLEPSMPLPVRQARDVLLFTMSVPRYVNHDGSVLATLIADALGRAQSPVVAELLAASAKLVRARRLVGPLTAWTGPEGRSLAMVARAFETLDQRGWLSALPQPVADS